MSGSKGKPFMTGNSASQSTENHSLPNPTIARLVALVGTWDVELSFSADQPPLTGGQATFEWLEEGHFLIERSHGGRSDVPKAFMVIGSDDTLESYTMLYYDSRGVSRLYQMSLNDQVWMLWRDAPGFYQRFTGEFVDGGNTIRAKWEKSSDGSTWELDFHLTYTKVK
jgi:hypothetical protein